MGKGKLDNLGISAFCESMGMMIQAGISIEEAISLLKPEENEGELAEAIKKMNEDMAGSVSLAEAMKNAGAFPDYAVNMVKAAQNTGKMEQTMFHLSDYYKNEKNMNENLRSALLYPASMLIMIIAVLFIMLKMVLPVFTRVYESLGGNMASGAFPYVSLSYTLCRILLIVMIIVLALLVIGIIMWKGNGRNTVRKLLRAFPVTRNILDTLALLRFTSGYDMYLSSGAIQDEALNNSLPLADNEAVEEKLRKIAEQMENGNSFAKSAYDNDLYEPVYGRTLIPAERSGNLESALRRLVSLLKEESGNLISHLVNTLEPLLSCLLMLSIAVVLLSLMLPLIGIMNSIG
ncbi:MAG: type II secretion system F family protein [Erysipelotrichaceae bacterium]|nr:type II secretion system F family protein [Erysipelotrichaceae bacterium]